MKQTIEIPTQIDKVLCEIDLAATQAINKGRKLTVEWSDNAITEKQFNALHVWIRHCVNYLNENNHYRCSPVSGKRILWTEIAFKEDVYKVLLKIWKDKKSTKDQNTSDPEEIRLALSGHLATAYESHIHLPEWPSNI